MADRPGDFLGRFREWRRLGRQGLPVVPGDDAAIGNGGGGMELPAGAVEAAPVAQATLYVVLTGTGACWQARPSVNPLTLTGAGEWSGTWLQGHIGRCAIDTITLSGDAVSSEVMFFRNGVQVGPTQVLFGSLGGNAAPGCGCGLITIRTFAA